MRTLRRDYWNPINECSMPLRGINTTQAWIEYQNIVNVHFGLASLCFFGFIASGQFTGQVVSQIAAIANDLRPVTTSTNGEQLNL